MANHGTWKRLGSGKLLTEDADEGLGHIVPISDYNKVFALLVFLTAVTVWAASWHVSETAHLIIAMVIAFIKAAAVFAIFMHLRFESKALWFVATYPLIILALMIIGTTGDTMMKRENIPMVVEVTYKQGQAFGIDDKFLLPNPEKTADPEHH